MVSGDQEFESNSAGGSGSGRSLICRSGLSGAEDLLPRWLRMRLAPIVPGAGCRQESPVPHPVWLSLGLLRVLTEWQRASTRATDPRDQR